MFDPSEHLSLEDLKSLACKYDVGGTSKHEARVAELCEKIFDLLASKRKLDNADKAALQCSAYLHDIGHFVDTATHDKQSSYLIRNEASLAHLPYEMRLYIACIAGSHRKSIRKKLYEFDHDIVLKALELTGILRTADALSFMEQLGLEIKNISLEHGNIVILHSSAPVKDMLPRFSKKSKLLKETMEIGVVFKN